MKKTATYLFHTIAYYTLWVGCLWTASHHHSMLSFAIILPILTLQIIWQIFFAKQYNGLWQICLIFACNSLIIDSAMLQFGVINFQTNVFAPWLAPPWLIAIWICTSIFFYATTAAYFHHYGKIFFLTLGAIPFLYSAGINLGAGQFTYGWHSAAIIAVIWAIMVPLSLAYFNSRRLLSAERGFKTHRSSANS